MITITCTNCQATLTMDEAFAGGVCRCQHCGTIQTVPKSARHGDESSGVVAQAAGSQRTLWRQKGTAEANQGTGLDDLADVVASSGLVGSGLKSNRLRKKPAAESAGGKNKKLVPILAGAGAAVVLGIGVIVWLSTGKSNQTANPPSPGDNNVTYNAGTPNQAGPALPSTPNFAGVDLTSGHTIAFVIDSGSGSADALSAMKGLTLKSIASLGADRKFQIVFWQVRGNCVSYPETGPTVAGDMSLPEATRKLDDVGAFGSSTVGPALTKAGAASPDVIILATGKASDLPDDFASQVSAAPAGAKIYAFSFGDTPSNAMSAVAKKTGGQYKNLTNSEAQSLVR